MKRQVTLFLITLIVTATIWLVPSHVARYSLSFALLWVLPGLNWASLIPHHALDRAERLAVGLGLNFAITPIVTLLLVYLPGPLTRASLLTAMVGVIGLPMVVSTLIYMKHRRTTASEVQPAADDGASPPAKAQHRIPLLTKQHPLWRDGWVWVLVALLIAAGLRVANLNYAEFEGDEARVMMRAARALEGDETIIFQHDKGPSQLTVAMAGWRLTGITNEWMSRLPFSWASILGVAAVFLYIRSLGRPHAGGIAACLLAIEGFLVGLGRGMRHHSLVFVLTTLGLLCLLAYYKRGYGILVIAAAVLFAGAAHAHYDAILVLPVGLLLVGARLWLDHRRSWRAIVPVVIAGLVGAVLTALFYLPFRHSPYVGGTSYYLSQRIGGHVYNNLWSSFELSAVYNSVYFLVALAVALAGQALGTWRQWGLVGLMVCAVLLIAMATGFIWPERWIVRDTTLAWAPFAILLLGALFSPRQPLGIRVLWLWMGIPALFLLFFVALPLTHVYTIFPAWAMLAAIGLDDLGRWLVKRARVALYAAAAGGAAVYILCAIYPLMLFVDYTPEYLREFPESQSPVYWTPYDQKPTEVGLYGFPYRVGWKVVGYLIGEGQLVGSYTSNEKPRATGYYTRQSTRLDCASPDMYIVATDVHDQIPLRWDQIEAEYQPVSVVTVGGQPRLTVYRRDATGPPLLYRVEEYERLFDLGTTPERVAQPASSGIEAVQLEKYTLQEAFIGDFAHLLGYKIDDTHAIPGGYVELTLLWQSMKPTSVDYHVFTHLHDGERMRGQLDGQPVCGNLPTSHWQPGQIIVDPYRIPIWPDAPPGTVPLTIGMYDFVTMQRLPVSASDGTPVRDSVCLTEVEIQAP